MINADVYLERKENKTKISLGFWELISITKLGQKLQDQEMYVVLKNQYINSNSTQEVYKTECHIGWFWWGNSNSYIFHLMTHFL